MPNVPENKIINRYVNYYWELHKETGCKIIQLTKEKLSANIFTCFDNSIQKTIFIIL
jgi:hypothetical protein